MLSFLDMKHVEYKFAEESGVKIGLLEEKFSL